MSEALRVKFRTHRRDKNRDPNYPARDVTMWFAIAFTCSESARLAGQFNAPSEERLLAHFRAVATETLRLHYWPPGRPAPLRRLAMIEPEPRQQAG